MDQEEVGKLKTDSLADMSDRRRLLAGGLISAAYLAVMAVYFLAEQTAVRALTPNELGDFLAGSFAPLAFLWLVLGFFQQGVELRNSTRALLIQAEELRNSVEQQRELVRVTADQLEYEKDRATRAEAEADRLARPKLMLSGKGSAGVPESPNMRLYMFKLVNAGATCTDVHIQWDDPGRTIHLPALPSGDKHDFNLRLSKEELDALALHVSYVDGRGNRREEEIIL